MIIRKGPFAGHDLDAVYAMSPEERAIIAEAAAVRAERRKEKAKKDAVNQRRYHSRNRARRDSAFRFPLDTVVGFGPHKGKTIQAAMSDRAFARNMVSHPKNFTISYNRLMPKGK